MCDMRFARKAEQGCFDLKYNKLNSKIKEK